MQKRTGKNDARQSSNLILESWSSGEFESIVLSRFPESDQAAMHVGLRVFPALLSFGIAVLTGGAAAGAELIALKSGETIELWPLFWVANCRSLLTGPPVAEVLEGLPELTVREQQVLPRKMQCAKEVSGGMLMLTAAKDLKARTQGELTIRIKYPTKEGERQKSLEFDVTLFP